MLKTLVGFDRQTMSFKTELIGGLTTFLTMSYILAVNPSVLATTGMDKGAVFTATALASSVATLAMAFLAKLPFAQAPGMGMNAFFAFTIVLGMGYSWEMALTAVLIEGIIFIIITLLNIREIILESIPKSLRYAISTGIGLFIAFIGLHNAGIVEVSETTCVTLGRFTSKSLLAMFSILLSGILMIKKVKGSLFFSIMICTIMGIFLGITALPEGTFSPISIPQSLKPTFCKFDFSQIFKPDVLMAVFTMLFLSIFDTIGTLLGVVSKTNLTDQQGNIPRMKQAMLADAIGTTLGAILGTSTVTTYVESASGVAEGARSGLASVVTGLLFLLALFFSPVFLLIPSATTTGALVLVGVFMMDSLKKIDLSNLSEAFPAFVTMIMMPLTYSISNGIAFGLLTYIAVKIASGKRKDISWVIYILAGLFILRFIYRIA